MQSLAIFPFLALNNSLQYEINSLPNDKILALCIFGGFADNKINATRSITEICLGKGKKKKKNTEGKEENAVYQHFLFFPQYFLEASSSWSIKVGIVL